jgi:tetratricopeptide (TPR) repeat protein
LAAGRSMLHQGPLWRLTELMTWAASAASADALLQAKVLHLLGDAHLECHRWPEAADTYGRALDHSRRARARELEGDVLGDLCQVHRQLGAHAAAREAGQAALAIFQELGLRKKEGRVLSSLGVTLFARRQWKRAREMMTRAMRIHEEVGDVRYVGVTASRLAEQELERGELEASRDSFAHAIGCFSRSNDSINEGLARMGLGNVYHQLGRGEEARTEREAAAAALRSAGHPGAEGLASAAGAGRRVS